MEAKRPAKPVIAEPWPSSLYARPRIPVLPVPIDEKLLAEDILEGCRAAVQQIGVESITSLGVTSTLRGEGRTTVAIGMALALAEYGIDTVLVEMDMVQPQLAHRLSVPKFPGLGDLAEGRAELSDMLYPVGAGLKLIPGGQVGGSIPRALGQLARNDVVSEIMRQGQVVVADLPPLLGSSLGRQAAGLVADLVLVVRAGVAPARSIKEAVDGLAVAPKVLLNGTHTRVPDWAARLAGI